MRSVPLRASVELSPTHAQPSGDKVSTVTRYRRVVAGTRIVCWLTTRRYRITVPTYDARLIRLHRAAPML